MIAKQIFKIISAFLERNHWYLTNSLAYLSRPKSINLNRGDFVRMATLELVAYEINKSNREGAVAELGVYKGDFSSVINQVFPGRKLYLFDTFEGFDSRNIETEIERGFSTGKQDFSNTSVDLVLSKMKFKQNCIVKKGFFPETANDVEDNFVFVSIDTDLYDPILSGLRFFYPKLVKGGVIFVHDFNNEEYKGARNAVEKFCEEFGVRGIPIPDLSGTFIIVK